MKILIVNKFLHPNGGSETYVFQIGKKLADMGHEVQYFGMEHENRVVGNRIDCYTANMDFHTGKLLKLLYPFKIIYSREAKQKICKVLEDFKPDVVHLNNFNFQLTPSILYGIKSYEKKSGNAVKIIVTAHDSQLVCPNHLMQRYVSKERCQDCLGGHYVNCIKNRCIHGSFAKSFLGAAEGLLYKLRGTYRMIDTVICPSKFMAEVLSENADLRKGIVVVHNFVDFDKENRKKFSGLNKEDYVLYFGRYSQEKGIGTLLEVCKKLPHIPFVFAGSGPLETQITEVKNIKNKGFLSGDDLREVIHKARFTLFTSECYENCPFAVIESQIYGTPVIAADIGGTRELLWDGETGELYECGNREALKGKIEALWKDEERLALYTKTCEQVAFDTTGEYCERLLRLYQKDTCKKGVKNV